MTTLHIRALFPQEDPPIALLLLADPSPVMLQSYLSRGYSVVGEVNHQIVGVYVLLDTRAQTVELINIAVTEEMQGHGIGKQLVLHAIETARSRGYTTLEIGTGNSSIGQLALYQKCGFRIVSVDLDFFTRHYPEIIYENGMICRDMIRLALDL